MRNRTYDVPRCYLYYLSKRQNYCMKGLKQMDNLATSTLTNHFFYDKKLGDQGEEWVKAFLLDTRGIEVYKCDTPAFRSVDVDFTTDFELSKSNDVEQIRNTKHSLIEVKTDKSKCLNQCLEVISNLNTNSPGWAIVTEADYIFSVFPNLNRCYVYDAPALKAYAESIKDDDSVKSLITNTYGTGSDKKLWYKSLIKLVSRNKLKELGILIREYRLDDYKLMYKAAENGKVN